MTGEEMERAVEFLIQSHADFDSRMGSLAQRVEGLTQGMEVLTKNVEEHTRQIAQTDKQLETLIETQNEFTQFVMRHIEAQGEINKRTDERLNVLINTIEKYVAGQGRQG